MNRAERRKKGIKTKVRTINVNVDYLESIKKKISDEATRAATEWMLCVPVMVLHDKFSEIRLKEFDGVCREEHFFDLCLDLYDSYCRDFLTINDMADTIKEETGFDITKRFINKEGFRGL